MINKIINYINEHTSPYDNDLKIGFILLLTAFLMILKGDILN